MNDILERELADLLLATAPRAAVETRSRLQEAVAACES